MLFQISVYPWMLPATLQTLALFVFTFLVLEEFPRPKEWPWILGAWLVTAGASLATHYLS